MKLNQISKAINKVRRYNDYVNCYYDKIDEFSILLEAGQGKHTDGNIFAILRCIETNPAWSHLTPYVVITKDSKQEAEKKFKYYGFKRYRFLVRDSLEYMKILATAKYLVTDNSFPTYFIKRDEQVYLNTWHGTPLKILGRTDITNAISIGNIQKNFLSADYLLFPNQYTKDIMMRDFMIEKVFCGTAVVVDYPRNDVLFSRPMAEEISRKYNPEGKKIIAYMPTWRGSGRNANIQQQVSDSERIIRQIEESLNDDELLFVNFHFLIGSKIDFSQFEKAMLFPSEYETYDFLAICDTLISDYSSVMLDFAQTGRDIIMYMYDYEEYLNTKGFYFDIRTLPFKQAYNINELIEAIHLEHNEYTLDRKFVGSEFGHSSEKMLAVMTSQDANHPTTKNHNIKYVYAGNVLHDEVQYLTNQYIERLSAEEKQNTVFGFSGNLNNSIVTDFLSGIDDNIDFIKTTAGNAVTLREHVELYLNRYYGLCSRGEKRYREREFNRAFKYINCSEAEMLQSDIIENYKVLSGFACKTTIHNIPLSFMGGSSTAFYRNRKLRDQISSCYDEVIDYSINEDASFWDNRECTGIFAMIKGLKCKSENGLAKFSGKIIVKTEIENVELGDALHIASRVFSDSIEYRINYNNIRKKTKGEITEIRADFVFYVPSNDFSKWYTNNIIRIVLNIDESHIPVKVLAGSYINPFVKRVSKIEGTQYYCELREDNKYYSLIIREGNVTDAKIEQVKLLLAFILHILTWWNKKIVIFEKNCSRYEESGAILFEKLVDNGYRNVRFILDKNYKHREDINIKYKKYIDNRFSFRHYYDLFAAKSIISSETIGHALEKNTTSRLFKTFILNGGNTNYVFLQHGVMYMVSLSAEQRTFFKKRPIKGKQRVVVSSSLEAYHFIDNTGYLPDDMYKCGLLKFDKSYLDDNADKIIVMLTWRPWEYVNGITDIKETGYYHMLHEIVSCIPEEMHEKLIVLPHPLIEDQVSNDIDDLVWKYYKPGVKYDVILRSAKLFISDYSSITYDAFYRGTNIVFYWKEKDQCMQEYGNNSKLMLTEDIAFGDVCYDPVELKKAIIRGYNSEQSEYHKNNYSLIVEHHDNHNTERFIKMAKADGVL